MRNPTQSNPVFRLISPTWLCMPLLLAAVASGCASSGGQTGDEFGSTAGQGGSIDESRIRVVLVGSKTHVVGEPGAVPKRASVSVKDVQSGAVVKAQADAEGAFDVSVMGEVDAEYQVAVEGSSSIEPVTVEGKPTATAVPEASVAPTATGGEATTETDPTGEPPIMPLDGGAGPMPSENPAPDEARRTAFEAFVAEHSSCAVDSDCKLIFPDCPLGCSAYVNVDAEVEALALAEELGGGCDYDCAQSRGPACLDGQCAERPEAAPTSTEEGLVVPPATDEQVALCEDTGGAWTFECGDYYCGNPPLTSCALGGCDCGADRNFGPAGCELDPECAADGLELTLDGQFAYPTADYVRCAQDSDCVLVGNSCSGCCTDSAVNVELRDAYVEERTLLCADYEGGQCDCQAPEREARCTAGECSVIEL